VGKKMLERLGLEVIVAADGRQALALFRAHPTPVRCVILDLTMPQMDGEETFRELRRLDHGVRVVIASGYNEQEVEGRFVGQGLAGFIQKPFQLTTLRAKLRAAFGD